MNYQNKRKLFALTLLSISACTSNTSIAQEELTKSKKTPVEGHIDLCPVQDEVYFYCTTKNKKTISLCGNKSSEKIVHLTYRFGTPGKTELSYTQGKEDTGSNSFYANVYERYRTEYVEISFKNNRYEYRIFNYYDAADGKENVRNGVQVNDTESGKEISTIHCQDTKIEKLKSLVPYLECDTDSALGCSK
ncbi:hypothetical protein [[Pseudomonas] boreopolis]|uniref:hypothetical protein n=1 Tax=Xanthomonas boreopolis TaxID=86183 RepID=UPI003D9BFE23